MGVYETALVIFRDFNVDGDPESGPYQPKKSEIRDWAAEIASFASGGGLLLSFDTGTADADPGAGNIRFDHATPGSVTFAYVSESDRDGADIVGWLASLDDEGNADNRGRLILQVDGDASVRREFIIAGDVVPASGYFRIPLSPVFSSPGSIVDEEHVALYFTSAGADGAVQSVVGSANLDVDLSDPANPVLTPTGLLKTDGTNAMIGALPLTEISTPSTPAAGTKLLYPKADGNLYTLNDAGIEVEVGSGGGGGSDYDTKAAVQAATISGAVNSIRTAGYAAAGDEGGALYKRVGSQPSHAGKIQSADGAWWELVGTDVHAQMLGANGDWTSGVPTDDATAIQAAVDYVSARGGGKVRFSGKYYGLGAAITLPAAVELVGVGSGQYPSGAFIDSANFRDQDKTVLRALAGFPAAPMLRCNTSNAALYTKQGLAIRNLMIDAAGIAPRGIDWASVKNSKIENVLIYRPTTHGLLCTVLAGANVTTEGNNATQFNTFRDLTVWLGSTGSAQGIVETGNATHNCNQNHWENIKVVHADGIGWYMDNCDNEAVYQYNAYCAGTGKSLVMEGHASSATETARNNRVFGCELGGGLQVTNPGLPANWNQVYGYSLGNASPIPIVAAGTQFVCQGDYGLMLGTATGALKGTGTINATAVYDDNVLLTCYVLELFLDGKIDLAKWDVFCGAEREHGPARRFAALRADELDPANYAAKWKRDGFLPGMPTPGEWEQGNVSVGDMVQRLWETAEIQAVHIAKLTELVAALEKKSLN